MTTFHGFIPENCVNKKVKVTELNSYTGKTKSIEGTVITAEEDCLYLDNGCYCLMKDLEMGDACLEWLD